MTSDGKMPIGFSSPPEFKGEPGLWTPEDLFVGALETCFMATLMSLAQRKHIPVLSYSSNATGTLEYIDGSYRISRVLIRPNIVTEDGTSAEDIRGLLREAHKQCFVANSILSVVEVQPAITNGIAG
jgi:organic hydroperoxide reductase OsmC/OhrA